MLTPHQPQSRRSFRPEVDLAGVSKGYGRGSDHPGRRGCGSDDSPEGIRFDPGTIRLTGKSTLMLMIAGLVKPSSGAISIQGRNVEGPLRSNGIVFQTPVLLPWRTILENVMVPIELMGEDVKDYEDHAFRLLDIAGIAEFADRLPDEMSGRNASSAPASAARLLVIPACCSWTSPSARSTQ